MRKARLAQASDLERLLDLFRVSEVSSIAEPRERAERIWSETLTRKGVAVFVSDAGAKIAATCMLITAPKPSAYRTWTRVPRKRRNPSRISWARSWSRRRSGCTYRSLGGRLLPHCFKAAAPILASIASTRVVASNRELGPLTLRTAQHKLISIAAQMVLSAGTYLREFCTKTERARRAQ
jgi:hypothetical protein